MDFEDASTPVKGIPLGAAHGSIPASEPAVAVPRADPPVAVRPDRSSASASRSSGRGFDVEVSTASMTLERDLRLAYDRSRRKIRRIAIVAGIGAVVLGGLGTMAAFQASGEGGGVSWLDPVMPGGDEYEEEVIVMDDEPTGGAEPIADDEIIIVIEDDEEPTPTRRARPRRPSTSSSKPTPQPAEEKSGSRWDEEAALPANAAMLDERVIRRTIRGQMFGLHRCYDTALKRNPGLQGRYLITISIGTTGKIRSVRIDDDTLRHSGVAACIQAKIKLWRFKVVGRLPSATEVTFPVVFIDRRGRRRR